MNEIVLKPYYEYELNLFEEFPIEIKKLLKRQIKFYRRNRLKCSEFCNAHCAYECPNIAIGLFEDWYGIPASDVGMYEISCRNCRFYDRYMTCSDCYFLYTKLCKYHSNFEKGGGFLNEEKTVIFRHCRRKI